jgi:1-acyl-sn-glycerol-3-phosphate acyltransferase
MSWECEPILRHLGICLPRCRLAALWLSQTSRVLADNALRMFVVLQVAERSLQAQDFAWHLINVFYYLPFILLAPIHGALGNELPKQRALVAAAAYCLLTTVFWLIAVAWIPAIWLWLIGLTLVMAGAALFSPVRYALLPAAAQDTRLPLSRINGLMEMGASVAAVAGIVLIPYVERHSLSSNAMSIPAALILANLVCLVAALPVWFASDVRRPESAGRAVAGFFHDCGRIWRVPDARRSLLLLASFWGILMAGSGAVFAFTHGLAILEGQSGFWQALIILAVGTASGAFLAGLQGHPRRSLGLVPLGAFGMLIALAWAGGSQDMNGPAFALGFMAGVVLVPLRATYQASVPADARGNALAISNTANYFIVIALALPIFGLIQAELLSGKGQVWLIAGLAAIATSMASRLYLREILELLTEFLIWPFYRIKGRGPGLECFPQGPVLVLANHSSWIDPVWLAKVLPRRVTPMMTSLFYDKPFLRWLMVRIVHAIRVEASFFRREAPELKQAVAALERGECVIVFPEGRMRRREDQLVHRFGQGIWHILRERPSTPVVPCWIEGGWGSCFSYRGGPPGKNKRLDWRRRITVVVGEPRLLEPSVLADHLATRTHLMEACLSARRDLGLEAPPASAVVLEESI